MPIALRGGTETNWRVWQAQERAQKPDTLLLHCSLAHSGAWKGVAPKLERPCTAFDLPAHGRSGPVQEDMDFAQQCFDVAQSFLGPAPIDVVGHSFGAVVALRLAMEHPASVRRLVLIEPVLFSAAKEAEDFDHQVEIFAPFTQAFQAGDMMRAAEVFTADWSDGTPWHDVPEPKRQALADLIHVIPREDPAILDDNAGLLRPGWLEATEMPVLLIEGSESPAIIDTVQNTLERRLPNTQRARITGAGHMSPLTHAAEVAAQISAFLDAA